MEKDFFANPLKGELANLRKMLQSSNAEVRINAMKRVLAVMLRGTDVDLLFPEVLKSAQTDNIKLKKLVFLYLSDTAERQPELAMLAVNTLTQDMASQMPLVRALALRTAAGMRVQSLTEHLVAPLTQCLSDEDAYVRKVAVLTVAKLHLTQRQWVEDMGLVDRLQGMLSDANAAVLVNVLAALMDMRKLQLTEFPVVTKLVAAMSESHEWGQVVILEAIARFQPSAPWQVQSICDKVTPFLAHSNTGVVFSAVKTLLPLIEHLQNQESKNLLMAKLAPPLKTLLCDLPAIQYVALRNIQIILQKYPQLIRDVRIFYIKYNDPIYVKIEKVEVLVRVAGVENVKNVLLELREYAGEADIELVRSAILAIGRCALKLEQAADLCVKMLLQLVESNISYVIESVIIAFRDIFRCYPKRYEQAINTLSGRWERLDDAEARGAFVWMLGEYASNVADVETLLEDFVTEFAEETAAVQLAILTAVVKTFLVHPTTAELVQSVLNQAVQGTNPDLRDRAFIYWRLLSSDPEAAREVVLAEKPPIAATEDNLPPSLLDTLLREIGTLASVYHKNPSDFEETKKEEPGQLGITVHL